MRKPNKDDEPSRFHTTEIAIQERLGLSESINTLAKGLIRDEMPEQHRDFFKNLSFIMVTATDDEGRPWIFPITGVPGFIETDDSHTLSIKHLPILKEELHLQISEGKKVGLLGIELATRRRNRMNGIIKHSDSDGLIIHVEQSFGNCRKFIQKRALLDKAKPIQDLASQGIKVSSINTPGVRKIIEDADTFFIGSRTKNIDEDTRNGMDASHRGGNAGFVKVDNNGLLCFPDFSGNRFFNTLGNIGSDHRTGLFFTDFDTGDSLLMTGKAKVIWDEKKIKQFQGAERLVEFTGDKILLIEKFLPFRHKLVETSPTLAKTGTWENN